jgi:DNA-binding NtrC family response regulator
MHATYDLHPDPTAAADLVGLRASEVERELIIATLQATGGNRTHAAVILDISIRALRYKLREYASRGLDIPAAHDGDTH